MKIARDTDRDNFMGADDAGGIRADRQGPDTQRVEIAREKDA